MSYRESVKLSWYYINTVGPHYNVDQYNTKLDITWSDLIPQYVGYMTVHFLWNGMKPATDQANFLK